METYYARWYAGQDPAVFRLRYDLDGKRIVSSETWRDGWVPQDWSEIAGWVDFITTDELPAGVTP